MVCNVEKIGSLYTYQQLFALRNCYEREKIMTETLVTKKVSIVLPPPDSYRDCKYGS